MTDDRLGPYRIERELGAGGMGTVYAARVERATAGMEPGERVALKVVHAHLIGAGVTFERFQREAEIGLSVSHENVVRTLQCASDGDRHYLVLEYVEGQTLRDLLKELDPVPEELCRHVGREICKGLVAIHGAGAVHRDLKPENVLITPDHVVKVMDLGIARLIDEEVRLSQTGAFVGSVEYAAPEQFTGGEIDGRADLHALGLVLYELSTGTHPYRGGPLHEVLQRICSEPPRRLGELNPQLSPFFEEVVHTLLAKEPGGRFTAAAPLVSVLAEGEESRWWHEHALEVQAETKQPLRRIRIPRETAVYGRADELAALEGLYERACDGEGQVVLIEGEAGIGKSRLADEFVANLHARGEDVNFLFGSYPPGGATLGGGAFTTAFSEQLGAEGAGAYLGATPMLVPAFDALLRGDVVPEGAQALTREAIGTCFVRTTRGLAAERVTIVLIDDLHFASEDARSLFSLLAMATPGHRVVLIGTMRRRISREWLAGVTRLDHATHLELSRLEERDIVRLLVDALGSRQVAADLGRRIAVKSDGNPFFAFEIVRSLREGQILTRAGDGTWATTGAIDQIQIPSSVIDLVNARVAGLSEEERDLLDIACCCGFEFDPVVVGEAVGLRRIPALKLLGRIERQHRLVRSKGRAFVFDHHQVQEVLYDGLGEVLREEYHAALADALADRSGAAEKDPEELDGALCVELLAHYLEGAREEDALRYLGPAQAALSAAYRHDELIRLTERALSIPGLLAGRTRVDVLRRLGGALDVLGIRERQEECAHELEQLAEEADDNELRGLAASDLGRVYLATSRPEPAEEAFRRVEELARARGDEAAVFDAMAKRGTVYWSQGRLADARELLERNLEFARSREDRGREAGTLGSLGLVILALGDAAEAQRHHERSLALHDELEDRPAVAKETVNLANTLQSQGQFTEAQALHERALALNREVGERRGEAITAGNLGLVLHMQGRHAEAAPFIELSLALYGEIGDRRGEAIATGSLADLQYAQGRFDTARELQERKLALCRETGHRIGEAIALVNLGAIAFDLGDFERAREWDEQSLALCREIGARYPEGYALHGLAQIADEEGDAQRATRLHRESLELRRAIGQADGIAESLLELGELALRAGDEDASRAALTEAVEILGEQGRHPETAQGLAVLARIPGGDIEAALEALAEVDEHGETARLRWLFYRATGDRTHLTAAMRLLDALLAKIPADYHDAVRTNLRVHREIVAESERLDLDGLDGAG